MFLVDGSHVVTSPRSEWGQNTPRARPALREKTRKDGWTGLSASIRRRQGWAGPARRAIADSPLLGESIAANGPVVPKIGARIEQDGVRPRERSARL